MFDSLRELDRMERDLKRWLPETTPLPPFIDRGLLNFITRISPQYSAPRHLQPLVDVLDAAERGPVRALISVPPRFGKTDTVLHAAARWLRRFPGDTVAYASYAADIAHSKSRLARDHAIKAGVQLRGDSNAVHEWRTTSNGGMIATGIGGPLTGHGAKLLIVDDPFANRQEAESAIKRQAVHDWFNSTALTRLEPKGSVLVVHTRWHGDDLIGRLEREGGWQVINLPALDELGVSLWEERWPATVLEERHVLVGEYDWASLYQGRPRPRGGALFANATRYDTPELAGARIIIGVDPAASEKTYADYSVAVVLAVHGRGATMRCDVLDVMRAQLEIPKLIARLRELQTRYPGAPMAVEAVGGFRAVPQMLRSVDPLLNVTEIHPATDKFIRAQPVSAAWNAGRVRIPVSAPWVAAFLDEVQNFTGVRDAHDDQVDALAHAWNHAHEPQAYVGAVDEVSWME
jgi:predicted phage terminase large subunit-like protein